MSSRQLVDKSVTNIFWSYLSFVSTKALNLVAIIIVARFLSPAEFGVMAFALVVIGFFELAQGFGLAAYLISTRDDVEEAANAVFAFVVGASATLCAALWFGADLLADLLDQPSLAAIMPWMAAALLIEAFASVHNSLLQRELKFRLKVMPEIARGLVKGLLSIALAAAGFGVWALVYGYVAGMAVWSLTLFVVRPWRPTGLPRLAVLGKALRYGGAILGGDLFGALRRSLDQLLIGKLLGAGPLGLYAVATRMPGLALKTFSMEASKVVHPVIAGFQTDASAVQRYYYGLVRYQSLVMMPMGAALAAMTSPLIHLLYTPEWHGVIAPMQLLSIAFALGTVNLLPGTVYKAINRSDYFLLTSAVALPTMAVVMLIAVPYGIEAAAGAHILLVALNYLPNFLILRRAIGIEAAPTVRAALPGLACALATGAAGLLAQLVVPTPGFVQLVATGAAAGVAGLIVFRLIAPEMLTEAIRIARAKLGKRGRKARKDAP